MIQFSKGQANRILNSGIWQNWTPQQICTIQLFQRFNCVLPSNFFYSLEKCLNRKLTIEEFLMNRQKLIKEFLKGNREPTIEDVLKMIPEDKLDILLV